MKKSLINSVFAGVLFVAGSASAATITFMGSVTDRTCSITGGTGTSGGAGGDFTVALPPVPASSLTAGNAAGDTGFSINITGTGASGTCQDGTPAKMSWNVFQTNIDPASGTLKNTAGTGAANYVGIALYNVSGTQINLNNAADAANPAANLSGGTAQLHYVAKYKAIGGNATAGAVQGALEYVVSFN